MAWVFLIPAVLKSASGIFFSRAASASSFFISFQVRACSACRLEFANFAPHYQYVMSEKYKFHAADDLYFTTSTVIGWVDLFTKPQFQNIIIESLKFCQREFGLVIYAWCIMSNHLHLIVSSQGDCLSDIFRKFKSHTSKAIRDELLYGNDSRRKWILPIFSEAADPIKRNKSYKIWIDGNHPVTLDNNFMLDQRLNYVHQNPVKAGLVTSPEDYALSSARDYAGEKGLIDVVLIE